MPLDINELKKKCKEYDMLIGFFPEDPLQGFNFLCFVMGIPDDQGGGERHHPPNAEDIRDIKNRYKKIVVSK